jgi:hypothetical protein
MGSREDRPWLWWNFSTPDDELDPLVEQVRQRDWAVFEGSHLDPEQPPPVALAMAKSSDGRMICTGLIVGLNEAYPLGNGEWGKPIEVTSRALRRIPVAELIGRAVTQDPISDHHAPLRRKVLSRSPESMSVRRAPGPKGHPDEHFRWVADQYRKALEANPRAPMAWLDERIDVDRSTITRWVQRARDKGFLGKSTPGRAGEVPEDQES